jgi:ion channel POLLUX/CASTOR
MGKPRLSDRLRYAFDNTLSRGPAALIGWLGLATLAMVILATVIDLAIHGTSAQLGPFQVFWNILSQALTPNPVDATNPLAYLLVMFFVTLGSLFMVSILISLLSATVEQRVEALRRGRSPVIETGHTVILGWSEQVFAVISELVIANENQRHACIVVLGEKDKVEMEDEIRGKVKSTRRTRIVCRTGSPMEIEDLEIVSLRTARSIIVLGGEADQDVQTIKTLLAIVNAPNRRSEPYHIVAEIRNPKNLEIARLAGRDEVELVLSGAVIARIIAQTCRQSGLSVVYIELLDFAGDEIYFKTEPALAGKSFGDALLAYEDSAVIGWCPKGGAPQLNPPMSIILRDDDQIIVIAEDDDTISLSGLREVPVAHDAIHTPRPAEPRAERTLILGWNWRAPLIINELDNYVAPNSQVTVVAALPDGVLEAAIARSCSGLKNQTVTCRMEDATDRRTLDGLEIGTYQHVIILCYSDTMDAQEADAHTLITLLHLRDIAEHTGPSFSMVSEMLNVRNRDLAEVTHADDFIVSDRLTSLLLSQISENKALNAVFTDIFDPEGSEIYLKPAANYVELGRPVNFYTVVEAARRHGEVAMGYRLHAHANDAAKAYGVVVNPNKSVEMSFQEGDRIIVLAEM